MANPKGINGSIERQSKGLEGKIFGKLTVLEKDNSRSILEKRTYWICQCNCEDKSIVSIRNNNLLNGKAASCGCQCCGKTHGMSKTSEHRIWGLMIDRCYNSNSERYLDYGGRGIKVCDRWLGENGFINFYEDMGERPENKTLDRFPDKNGNYEPTNCRWATAKQQNRNKRNNINITYQGKTQCLMDWSLQFNIPYSKLRYRVKHGWSPQEAFLN